MLRREAYVGVIPPLILNLNTRQRWMVMFSPHLL